jgi:hypothetical protein
MSQPDLFGGEQFKGPPEQRENIARVHAKIAPVIAAFFHERGIGSQFHVDDLRRYVARRYAVIAPDSAGRIMRDMRVKQWVDYEVVNRRASLYRITSLGEPA